ncbi:MAG: hypothetical protein AAFU38_03955 [Bacteroidota bacterium]
MRKLFTALTLALCVSFAAPQAQAQFSLFPYIGYNIDAEGFLIGIGGEFVAPFEISNLDLTIAPSVEYVFTEDFEDPFGNADVSTSIIQINGDVIARFNPQGSFVPYAGAGLAIVIFSVEQDISGFDASDTDIGINILGGAAFPGVLGFGDPFVQGRITLAGDTAIALIGGVRIPLGN